MRLSYYDHQTKNYLEKLHPNIAVMRHPDHIGAKGQFLISLHLPTGGPFTQAPIFYV
jgi:phospholipase D1/2